MKHEIDLKNYQIRTDLLVEEINQQGDGITIDKEEIDNIKITNVYLDENGSKKLLRKTGNYITIEFNDITDTYNLNIVKKIFCKKLKDILELSKIKKDDKCLIVGLGNDKSTPDSLGPITIENILVTNHLFELGEIENGYRSVSALIPGVTGVTGIETSELIRSVVEGINPDFLIIIDALASQSLSRLNKTIQISNTGIHPGSGVGNSRREISFDTIKIPVIAIGVPTVVDAVTVVSDTINFMHKHYAFNKKFINTPLSKLVNSNQINYLKKKIQVNDYDKESLLGIVGKLNENEIKQLIYEVLSPIGYNLMVTPKEVDFLIERLGTLIGNGINMALHENFEK